MLGTIVDVTDRKSVEEALRSADRSKDEFLATLAHELRNPLAPIRNALEIMRLTREPQTLRQRPPHHRAAAHADDPSRRRPARHQPHHPGQDRASAGPDRHAHGAAERGRDQPAADRGAASGADAAPAAGGIADRPGRRDPAGAGDRQPAQQRRQVHARGRPDRARRLARCRPGGGDAWRTRASAFRRRCCRGCSTCSPRSTAASSARRAASASAWRW